MSQVNNNAQMIRRDPPWSKSEITTKQVGALRQMAKYRRIPIDIDANNNTKRWKKSDLVKALMRFSTNFVDEADEADGQNNVVDEIDEVFTNPHGINNANNIPKNVMSMDLSHLEVDEQKLMQIATVGPSISMYDLDRIDLSDISSVSGEILVDGNQHIDDNDTQHINDNQQNNPQDVPQDNQQDNQPDDAVVNEKDRISQYFNDHCISQYLHLFEAEGFDELQYITDCNNAELIELGVKLGGRKKLLHIFKTTSTASSTTSSTSSTVPSSAPLPQESEPSTTSVSILGNNNNDATYSPSPINIQNVHYARRQQRIAGITVNQRRLEFRDKPTKNQLFETFMCIYNVVLVECPSTQGKKIREMVGNRTKNGAKAAVRYYRDANNEWPNSPINMTMTASHNLRDLNLVDISDETYKKRSYGGYPSWDCKMTRNTISTAWDRGCSTIRKKMKVFVLKTQRRSGRSHWVFWDEYILKTNDDDVRCTGLFDPTKDADSLDYTLTVQQILSASLIPNLVD